MTNQRGFIALPIMAWGAIAAGAVILALGVAVKVQTSRLETSKAEFATFKAETKAVGEAAEKARLQDILDRQTISTKQEADNAKRYATLNARYRAAVAAARLPGGNPGGSEAKPLSSASAVLSCPNGQPNAAGSLEQLEIGVLSLLERGDRAIERTITCKAWIDEQVAK